MKTKLPTPQLLPSGQYRCQVMVDGKRVSVVDADPNTAQAKAVALKSGLIEKAAESKMSITLGDAIDQYIENRRNVLSPSTLRGYKQIRKARFKTLMSEKVANIDEQALQRAINDESKTVSYKTIKNCTGLVIAVLTQYKIVNSKQLRFPRKKLQEHAYLEGDEIVKLITACRGDIAEIPILMAIWLGMRRSEILGLQWESIDFEKSRLHIDHSLVFDDKGNIVIKDYMKTDGSMRSIDCPSYILEKLRAIMPENASGRVFTIHPNTIYKNLKKICESSGITFPGVHGLRHTNASVMLSLGIVDKIAMARGGWSSKETLERIYQHLFQSDMTKADETINAFFESKLHMNLHTE